MSFDSIVQNVKGRVEPLLAKGQSVVDLSLGTFKQGSTIVVDGVQDLLKTELDAGKDLFAAAKASFEKAKADGLKAVAASPIEYLPEGRERFISAYNDTVTLFTKTGDKLVKTVKKGFDGVSSTVTGKSASARMTRAKTTTRKTAAKAAKAAKKTTRTASKKASAKIAEATA